MAKKNIAILGSGISGLSAAYALAKQGHDVSIFESGKVAGGVIQTTSEEGYMAEHGPNSIMLNDVRIKELLDDLELTNDIITADRSSAKRFVIKDGKTLALPQSPKKILGNKVVNFPTLLRLAREPFIKRDSNLAEQSFADFVRHRLGKRMLNYAAGPFVNGIYAGDPEQLHFRLAFPRMYKIVNSYRSLILGIIKSKKLPQDKNRLTKPSIISFKQGMRQLPQGFIQKLSSLHVSIKTEVSSMRIEKTHPAWQLHYTTEGQTNSQQFDHIISAVPAHRLGNIQFPDSVDLSHTRNIFHPPVASVLLGYKKQDIDHPLDGFGMLASLPEQTDILGALFPSSLFPEHHRSPKDHIAINVMLGGTRNPAPVQQSEEEIITTAHQEVAKVLNISGQPTYQHFVLWNQAIPQIGMNHQQVLDELEDTESTHPGLHFIGNYRGGISVGDSMINGLAMGEKIDT